MQQGGELTDEQKKATVSEFALGKGFAVAAMAGILSACFAFGLAAGKPIAELSIAHGTHADLLEQRRTGRDPDRRLCEQRLVVSDPQRRNRSLRGLCLAVPAMQQIRNYVLSALGGVIWYGQFFFYGMGTTKLGEKYDFSSWSIHMAFIIVFSNLWGIAFHEWRGTSGRTRTLVWAGILTLIVSTMVIGYGNYLAE